jgi:hypothetical protein
LETVDNQGISAHAKGFTEDLTQIDGAEIDRALDKDAIHQDAVVGIDGNEADARALVLFAADPDQPDGVLEGGKADRPPLLDHTSGEFQHNHEAGDFVLVAAEGFQFQRTRVDERVEISRSEGFLGTVEILISEQAREELGVREVFRATQDRGQEQVVRLLFGPGMLCARLGHG